MLSRSMPWRMRVALCLLAWLAEGAACPSGCTCQQETVTCTSSTLSAMPPLFPDNETVSRLVVSMTDITALNTSSFANLRQLRLIDFSNNLRLYRVEDGTFAQLAKLESLTLQRNSIDSLTNETFIGLESLTFLDLSYNRLIGIPEFCFHQLKKLEFLDLARNEIELERSLSFSGLFSLKTLNLTRNRLIYLDPEAFLPLTSLEILILEDNQRDLVIPSRGFAPLVALKRLSLNGNNLSVIAADAFLNSSSQRSGQVPLEILSLRGARLQNGLPALLLKTLTRLRSLDISNTNIKIVGGSSFSELHNLVNLTIDSCPNLTRIDTLAFRGLETVENLIITNNPMLQEIGAGAFSNMTALRLLDLKNNKVPVFLADTARWADLDLVDLRDNPITCDCRARWMLALLTDPANGTAAASASVASPAGAEEPPAGPLPLRTTTVTTGSLARQIRCAAPPWNRDKLLPELSFDDFTCPAGPGNKSQAADKAEKEKRFKVGLVAAGITCACLLAFAVFVKFRRRICSACRGQYRYKAYHSNGVSTGSAAAADHDDDADAMELEDTQFEDLDTEDIDTTKVKF